jgi:transposase InsO family protein
MKISTSGYYSWRKRLTKPPSIRRKTLKQLVNNCYWENRKRYGTRRIRADLQKSGIKIGRYQIRRFLKEENLQAIQTKSFKPRTTDSKGVKASPNLLKELKIEECAASKIIIGDITYLPMKNGKFCYLAMWQDKITRRIIGWRIDETMTAELVISALEKGIKQDLVKAGAIIHSDRGSQYGANGFRKLLQKQGFRQSMCGKGNCYDNAQAESFFSRFKAELLENGVFEDVEQAESEAFSYIEGYYNRVRIHSSLGNKSPMEFEAELKTKNNGGKESFVSI